MGRIPCSALATALLAAMVGCTRGPALPEQPADDPSARTTTLVNPVSTPQDLAEKCDVPFYPGAQAPDGMSRMPRKNADGSTTYDLVLTTHDGKDKVTKFYSDKFKLEPIRSKDGDRIMGKTAKKNDAIVTVNSEGGQTVIRINAIAYGH